MACPRDPVSSEINQAFFYLYFYYSKLAFKKIGRIVNKLNQKYIGSDFDNFLNEIGILEEVTAVAHKYILAEQLNLKK